MIWNTPIINPFVLKGTQPFLCMEITRKPDYCTAGNNGGEQWANSFVVIPAGDRWGDVTPFSAPHGSTAVANVFWHDTDNSKIFFNGVALNTITGGFWESFCGYSWSTLPLRQGYNELVGAPTGGTIFGYGPSRKPSGSSGGSARRVFDPEVKSFAHPIGVMAVPFCDPDTNPPTLVSNVRMWSFGPDDLGHGKRFARLRTRRYLV